MKTRILLLISLFTFGFSVAQTSKKSIVEHFTNSRCSVCGYKNPPMYEVLNSYPDVMHISYHPGSPYANCIFSQHNPVENDERAEFYNVYGGTPRVVLNGEVLPNQSPLVTEEDLDAVADEMSDFIITVSQSEAGFNQMNVKVSIQKVMENSLSNLNLYIALAENEINYNAPNGENIHHQVFRLKLGDEEIEMMAVNEIIEFNYSYAFHQDWQMDEMFAYAILQDDSKMVLQAAKSPLVGDMTGIEDQLIRNGLLNIGPNPSNGTLFISNSSNIQFNDISIFNVYGQLVLNQSFSEVLNVEFLDSGLYILQMQTIAGEKLALKFQKK